MVIDIDFMLHAIGKYEIVADMTIFPEKCYSWQQSLFSNTAMKPLKGKYPA